MVMRMDKQQAQMKALQRQVESLTDQVGMLTKQSAEHETKIERCETTAAFAGERRRAQQSCGTESVESMLSLCCDSGQGNGHRRGLQAGCAALPASCTAQCAAAFVPVFEGCRATFLGHTGDPASMRRQASKAQAYTRTDDQWKNMTEC